jgi:predicted DNA-binding transcriptional regulator AlpA
MKELPLLLTWKQLKTILGHPYSRAHTYRMMNDREYSPPFPRPEKPLAFATGKVDRTRAVWMTSKVLAWYKAKGIDLNL